MKLCISAAEPAETAPVDPRFGRAAAFCIYDTESGVLEGFANESVSQSGGAGVQAAQELIDRGVDAVLTGRVGPNAFRALAAAGIPVYADAGPTVQEAIEAFKSGSLVATAAPTNPGHSG
jgi:predicted Fe-Mo cluster-binding NifX family protein